MGSLVTRCTAADDGCAGATRLIRPAKAAQFTDDHHERVAMETRIIFSMKDSKKRGNGTFASQTCPL